MNKLYKIVLAAFFVILLIGVGIAYVLLVNLKKSPIVTVSNFNDCVTQGNPVMESYPRQCRAGGQTFTEFIGNELEKTDLIRINTPRPNQIISSPLTITGEARGTWFFEASFPVVLTDWDGRIIGQGIAQAQSNWMTTEFVQFKATLTFTADPKAYSNKATLILRKDNPSGLPENDDSLEIPVMLSATGGGTICTAEAKQCSDGSYVGRSGPNCEFVCPTAYDSGVQGTVTLGPTCPVMRVGDTACADRPYATYIQVITIGSPKSSLFDTVRSDTAGKYKVMLPPGNYSLQPAGGSVLPRCATKDVTIVSSKVITVDLSCDTGIR